MLLIPIGRGEDELALDHVEMHDCSRCGEPREFRLRLRYAWGSLFGVARWVVERQYQLACPACGHGWVVQRRWAESVIGGDPVPPAHRQGWRWLAGAAVLLLLAWWFRAG